MVVSPHRRLIAALLISAFTVFLVDIEPAQACASCACGDPTLTTLGSERAFPGRARLSSLFRYRSLELGEGNDATELEELQLTLAGALSLTDWLTISMALPVSRLTVDYSNLAQDRNLGIKDLRLSSRWVLIRDREVRARHLAGIKFELGIPVAPEATSPDGTPLPLDSQLDSGSWKATSGIWYTYFAYPWSAQVSARLRVSTAGRYEYQEGLTGFIDVQSQYQLDTWVALNGGLHARIARANTISGSIESDTGGSILFASAGSSLQIATDTMVNINGFVPVYAALEGTQREHPLIEFSVTTDF